MNTMFFIGVIVTLIMIPRSLSAMSSGRSPRLALFVLVCGLLMAAIPVLKNPDRYKPSTFATMVIDKIGAFIND